jgi:competence protein ComEC
MLNLTLPSRMAAILVVLLLALPATASPQQSSKPACVDINTASPKELEAIIHIGPERAAQIVQLRKEVRFRSVDELVRIKGIAAARLADIKKEGLACVR